MKVSGRSYSRFLCFMLTKCQRAFGKENENQELLYSYSVNRSME